MNRRPIGMRYYVAVSALFVFAVLANPCGAQAPPPVPTTPPVQTQAGQTPQATMPSATSGAGASTAGSASVSSPGVGSSRSSDVGKRFGSVGQGLPGMPGGPPIKESMGFQDPSSRYMRPPVIPALLCDPAINIPC
jgi:hypothetical protein